MWVIKSELTSFWVFLMFFLLFLGVHELYRNEKVEARYFLRFFDFNKYLRVYGHERDISFQRPFLVGIYFFCLIIFSFFSCVLVAHFKGAAYSVGVFLFFFGILLSLTVGRFILFRFLSWLFDIQRLSKWILFRTLACYGVLAVLLYGLCALYIYAPFENNFIFLQLGMGLFVVGHVFIHINTYYLVAQRHRQRIFYLFLYICTLKIAPLVWVFIWTKSII